MKQFLQQNLFITIMVGVVAVTLVAIVFPWHEVSQAREHAAELQTLHVQLGGAIGRAQSPKWVKQSDVGILRIRTAQERVIETSLRYGTRRPLLVNGRLIFPGPVQRDRFEFPFSYNQSLPAWLADLKAAKVPGPQDPEVIREEEDVKRDLERAAGPGGAGGPPRNIDARTVKSQAWGKVISRRASQALIWADEDSFDNYVTFLQRGRGVSGGPVSTGMTNEQLWYALLNYCVQTDLVGVLKTVNGERRYPQLVGPEIVIKPDNVRRAPVKELVWVQVDKQYYTGPSRTGGTQQGGSTELTGHVSNAKYDVLHYAFQVVMNPAELPLLVGTLSSKNFHTVLSLRCEPLSKRGTGRPGTSGTAPMRVGAGEGLPDYGNDPVTVVTFQCEVVFMKSPQSWRETSTQDKVKDSRAKRRAFFKKNASMVLKVIRELPNGQSQDLLTYEKLAADPSQLTAWLDSDDPAVRLIALYEDLMPPEIRRDQPKFAEQQPQNRSR